MRVHPWHYPAGHPIRFVVGCVVLAALVVAGDLFWRYLHSYESTDDAQVDGHIEAISSRVNGTVVAVYVENNQHVARSQALADLDPRDVQVALDQAQAGLTQAEVELAAEHPTIPITQTTNASVIAYVKVVQRLPVRIRFDKGQRDLDRLRPGMSVEPKVWVQ